MEFECKFIPQKRWDVAYCALPDTPIEPPSAPLGEGSSETSQRLRPRVTRSTAASASILMPPLLTIPSISVSPVENRGKEKETAGNRTRKRGDDDEAYRDNQSGGTGDAQ